MSLKGSCELLRACRVIGSPREDVCYKGKGVRSAEETLKRSWTEKGLTDEVFEHMFV